METPQQAAQRLFASAKKKGFLAEALHTYRNEKGSPIYWRIRGKNPSTGDKWIRPMRLVNGVYELGEPKFEGGKPLYKLDQLSKILDSQVWLVEGERCVDLLSKLGIICVTTGSSDSVLTSNLEPLRGRDVVLWRDLDDAGLHWQSSLIERLKPLGCSIQIVDVEALGLDRKGDVVDWLALFDGFHGHNATKTDILALPLITDPYHSPAVGLNVVAASVSLPSDDDAVIKYLASLKPIEYDRVRKDQAKLLGVQIKTLDSMVKAEREASEQDNSPFADIEPWQEAIAPAQLLDEITQAIQRFIVLDKHQAQAAALWVSACWFVNEIQCAPIALINAPERACGKTQLLTVLGKLAPRTAQASGISPSVLFRMIEAYQPTLFIDEIETILKDNEDLRGLINAGHTRDSAYVWRSVAKGDDFEPKRFTVWGMKAIAGINAIKLAETVTSRAIVFELRRKRPDEKVERLRQAEAGLFETLARKLARFSEDYSSQIREARPTLPNELGDRDQDNWEPLLQVATVAGGHWLGAALNAALKLSGSIQAPISISNELLADIQEIFETKQVIKISTAELIKALCEDAEKSWATYNRGKQLTPRQLSTKLKDYGIASKTIRVNSYETAKGYEIEQFNDAFTSYLADPLNYPSQSNNSPQANNDNGFDVTDKVTVTNSKAIGNIEVTLEPAPALACDVVTDKMPNLGGVSASHNDGNDWMEF